MRNFKLTTVIIYVVTVGVLAVTTFMSPQLYGSVWFAVMWGIFGVMLGIVVGVTRMWKNLPSLLLHLSFLLMLAGGLMTRLTGSRGAMSIAPGGVSSEYVMEDGRVERMPMTVALDSFKIEYYPGSSEAVRDYVSYLDIDGEKCRVSVNNVKDVAGYRLYQYSYGEGGRSVIGVNRDPYGVGLSYAGYILFALAGLLVMVGRDSGFRRALRALAVVALLFSTTGVHAESIAGVTRAQADSLSSRQVMYNGRLVTYNTVARDFLVKLYGKAEYRGLSAEQVMTSWLLYPESWANEPVLRIKSNVLRDSLGVKGNCVSVASLFDAAGEYKLRGLVQKNKSLERSVLELDEKVGMVMMLHSGELFKARATEIKPLSDRRVTIELLYNRMPLGKIVFMTAFAAAIFAFAGIVWRGRLRRVAIALLVAAMVMQISLYGMQWYMTGIVPLANMGDTMRFMVIVLGALTLMLSGKMKLLLPLGGLLTGCVALVSWIISANPVVTTLMPVLQSPWLSIHVTLVMTAYSLLAFTLMNSVIGLTWRVQGENMRNLNVALLYPALWLLGMGIFTGAVWANVSWGRYWAWDPKETWALITLMVYAVPLHRSLRFTCDSRRVHLYIIIAFLTVLMTYFGVNYMTSMHAYS